jgi:hypothetical protein
VGNTVPSFGTPTHAPYCPKSKQQVSTHIKVNHWRDEWPSMPDSSEYDGQQLGSLVRDGKSPFQTRWDVNLLISEIQDNIQLRVIDISTVEKGSNNYVCICSILSRYRTECPRSIIGS